MRCVLVLSTLTVPIVIVWHFVEEIFILLKVEATICRVISHFLHIRMLSLPADVVNLSFSKYLMAIGIMKPAMYTTLLNSVVLTIASTALTSPQWGLSYGYAGLGYAFVISNYIGVVCLMLVSSRLLEVRRTLKQIRHLDSFVLLFDYCQLKIFIALGLPGCAMICSEWW